MFAAEEVDMHATKLAWTLLFLPLILGGCPTRTVYDVDAGAGGGGGGAGHSSAKGGGTAGHGGVPGGEYLHCLNGLLRERGLPDERGGPYRYLRYDHARV